MPGVYTTKITNMLNQKIVTNYRMPKTGSSDDIKFNPVLKVEIQPRALLNEIVFANEHFYHHWKLQNENLFKKGILVEDEKMSENTIKAKHEDLIKVQTKDNKKVIESQVEQIEESAANVNATLHFEEVEAAEGNKNRRRRRRDA